MTTASDVQIRIRSAKEAKRWVHGWPTTVVSLVNPDDTHLIATSPRPDLKALRLLFADVTDPDHEHAATDADVAEIVALGAARVDGEKVLFHCRGGIGRSPAAAIICLVAAGWAPSVAVDLVRIERPPAKPNGWMLLLADQVLTPAQRGGVFSAYVQWAEGQEWWHPMPGTIVRDAVAGRLGRDGCIDLVKAQTHRLRGVDRGPHR